MTVSRPSSAARRTPPKRRLSQQRVQQQIFVWTVLVPVLVCLGAFWVFPLVRTFWGSFTLWRGFVADAPFVGWRYYVQAVNDPIWRAAIRNTFYYALLTVPAYVVLALLLALAMTASGRLRGLFRTAYFLPVVTSTIATALVFKWLFQPSLGLANQFLRLAHLPVLGWLKDPKTAMPSVALYATWKTVGFGMVIFSAGLTTIPPVYYDAARVDGANRWHTFRHITVPLLQSTVTFVLITGVLSSLQVFGTIYVMTGETSSGLPGGPNNSTMVVALYQWMVAFRNTDLGYGSAMGVVLFLVMLVLTLIQLRLLRMRWEY